MTSAQLVSVGVKMNGILMGNTAQYIPPQYSVRIKVIR